jgi:hypothetical protein
MPTMKAQIASLEKQLANSREEVDVLQEHLDVAHERLSQAYKEMDQKDRVTHYQSPDGCDYIDKTYATYEFREFVASIKWTIGKYFERFGKKDDIVKEAEKIRNYANRFYDKVLIEARKPQQTENQ